MNSLDRRRSRRYSISFDMQYTIANIPPMIGGGKGKILDVSTGGIYFQCDRIMAPDTVVHLVVDWAMSAKPMDWIVDCVVVRSDSEGTAVVIMRHRFEPRSSAELNVAS